MKKLLSTVCIALGLAGTLPPTPAQAQANPQMGQIVWMGFNFCPRGWAQADGRLLPIASNTAMFSLYGTTYGGDGRTTFALPNLNGRVAIGEGRGPGLPTYLQGSVGGAEVNTMTVNTMPSHGHTGELVGTSSGAAATSIAGSLMAGGAFYSGALASGDANMNPATVSVQSSGGSQAFTNMQPYLAQIPCVAMQGTYPSRP